MQTEAREWEKKIMVQRKRLPADVIIIIFPLVGSSLVSFAFFLFLPPYFRSDSAIR